MRRVLSFLLIILFSSCSSIKLLDSWKSEDFKSFGGKKILVAAKSPDLEIRKSYEKTIVKNLRESGINAIEMHVKFPNFSNKESRTKEENNQIVKQFLNEGINMIMVTSLKNKIETRNYSIPQSVEIPLEYKNKHVFESNTNDKLLNNKSLNSKSQVGLKNIKMTTYVLESITYDLSLEREKQLVNVCLVDVENPKSGVQILDKFCEIVSSQFKN